MRYLSIIVFHNWLRKEIQGCSQPTFSCPFGNARYRVDSPTCLTIWTCDPESEDDEIRPAPNEDVEEDTEDEEEEEEEDQSDQGARRRHMTYSSGSNPECFLINRAVNQSKRNTERFRSLDFNLTGV